MKHRVVSSKEVLQKGLTDCRQNYELISGLIQKLELCRYVDPKEEKHLLERYIMELIDRFADEDDKYNLLLSFGLNPDYPPSKYPSRPMMRVQHGIDHGWIKGYTSVQMIDPKKLKSLDRTMRNKEIPMISRLADGIIHYLEATEWQPLSILQEIEDMLDKSTVQDNTTKEPPKKPEPDYWKFCILWNEEKYSSNHAIGEEPCNEELFSVLFPELHYFLQERIRLADKDEPFKVPRYFFDSDLCSLWSDNRKTTKIITREVIRLIETNPAYALMVATALAHFRINQFYPQIIYKMYGQPIPEQQTIELLRKEYYRKFDYPLNTIKQFIDESQKMQNTPPCNGRWGLSKWYEMTMAGKSVLSQRFKDASIAIGVMLTAMDCQPLRSEVSLRNWIIVNPDRIQDAYVIEEHEQVEGVWQVYKSMFHPMVIGINSQDYRVAILPTRQRNGAPFIDPAAIPVLSPEPYHYVPYDSSIQMDRYHGEFELWRLDHIQSLARFYQNKDNK